MAPFARFKYKSSPNLPIHWQIPTAEPENSCPTCHGMIYTNLAHGGSNPPPKIPEFWKVPPVEPGRPLSYLAATLWRFLCIISIFRPGLEEHWVSKQDPRGWQIQKDRMVSRLSNTNTTAGLILATTAVFITAQPPRDTWDYSQTLANCLCIFALSHSLMSIWFGTFVIVVYQAMTRDWALKVLMKDRLRLSCTLMAFALPTCNLFLGTLCLLCAIATVTLNSSLMVLRASATIEGVLWLFFCLMTFWNLLPPSFWTVHLPHYAISLFSPFRRKRHGNNSNQVQGDSAV